MTHDQKQIQQMLSTLNAMDWPDQCHEEMSNAAEALETALLSLEDEFGNPLPETHPMGSDPAFERAAR